MASQIPVVPRDGWICFHCGEVLTTQGAARDHFGATPAATPACQIKAGAERGILMALRKAEKELARYREEDQALARELHSMQSRHSDALRTAEELGYERGLHDAKKQETFLPTIASPPPSIKYYFAGRGGGKHTLPSGPVCANRKCPYHKMIVTPFNAPYVSVQGEAGPSTVRVNRHPYVHEDGSTCYLCETCAESHITPNE